MSKDFIVDCCGALLLAVMGYVLTVLVFCL